MNVKEALALVSRYCPCPHDSIDTTLGDGKTWCKCQDCGEVLSQESLHISAEASYKFEDAIYTLKTFITEKSK